MNAERAPSATAYRNPPANLEAERALLGALMMNNRAFDSVADIINESHFSDPANAKVFGAIAAAIAADRQATPITLRTGLDGDPDLAAVGGAKYLVALLGSVVNIVNAADYARLLVDLAARRDLIAFANNVIQDAFDLPAGETTADLLNRSDAEITRIAGGNTDNPDMTLSAANALALADWQAADLTEDGGGVSTGIESLNVAMGTMRPGDLIVVAGSTSMGKTALATTIAFNAAAGGNRTAFFTLEMPADQMAGRILTGLTGIPGPRQRRWKLNANQFADLAEAQRKVADYPLVIRYAPGLTLPQLRAGLRRIKRQKGGLKLAVVDYLQIMGTSKTDRYENRTREISAVTMGLKNLAGEIGVPIILLSQLSREGAKRDNPRPILSDLRDSGSIEQDADTVVFVWREHYWLERNPPVQKPNEEGGAYALRLARHQSRLEATAGLGDAIIAKRRHGPVGTARMRFEDSRAWFSDADNGPPEPPPIEMPYSE